MKDYSLEKDRDFILNYTIENEKIYVNYADKKLRVIDYSKEEEIKILKQMREQAFNYSKPIVNTTLKDVGMFILFLLPIIMTFLVGGFSSFPIFFIKVLVIFVFGYYAETYLFDIFRDLDLIIDYKKNRSFVLNELNINLDLNPDLLTTKNLRKMADNKEITINDVDKLNCYDVAKLIKNTKHNDFDEETKITSDEELKVASDEVDEFISSKKNKVKIKKL